MSAVFNVTLQSTPPPTRHPKKRIHSDVEASKSTSDKLHCYVVSGQLIDGKVRREYTRATVRLNGDVASVSCEVNKEPSEKMKRIFPVLNDSEYFADNRVDSCYCYPRVDELSKVTTVLVNVDLKYSPEESPALLGIGSLFEVIFPNLNHRLSAVNLHDDCVHWRADDLLVPLYGDVIKVNPVLKAP